VPGRHNGVVEEESLTLVLDETEWSGSCPDWFGPEEGETPPPIVHLIGGWCFSCAVDILEMRKSVDSLPCSFSE